MDPDLTLEKAIQMTRQSEMLKSQQATTATGAVRHSGESKHKLLPKKITFITTNQTVSVADVVEPPIHPTISH